MTWPGARLLGRWLTMDGDSPVVVQAVNQGRFLLWVDAVGGFFVCQSHEIRLGQAVPESKVEIPLLADLSRHHATIRRDAEGYTIEPLRDVRLDGREIHAVDWLSDGALLELGGTLKMRFRRPHPLSATARLDFESHHSTRPSAAAIVLLAETCVLGPSSQSHVVCRDWQQEVLLYRQHGTLRCKSAVPFEIDKVKCEKDGPLGQSSRVRSEEFSFSLEQISS